MVEISDDGRRIRLCKKGLEAKASEPSSRPQQRRRPKPDAIPSAEVLAKQQSGTFGTNLADKLRAALDRSRQS